jgi:hypothetical protein
MVLPTADTPLYNHPLYEIEKWLENLGCQQDSRELNCWRIKHSDWKAEISLETEEIVISYLGVGNNNTDVKRAFKYSLSRQDIEDAILSGP